jgi:NADP-dependent aldehyde dehydrogenase
MIRVRMDLHGGQILGAETSREGSSRFRGFDAASGAALEPDFREATEAEIDRAFTGAEAAFEALRRLPADAIAGFLEAIAAGLEAVGAELVARAQAETGLPEARLVSERGRTVGQLRMFAALVREGSWVEARIDRGDPTRTPVPKPDLRRMLVPLGPIVVFGASNFPLAFSVCGGDTASALAAGNPVIAKGHPAHPGTSEIAARVVQEAARSRGLPPGVFSMVQGTTPAVGLALVRHPLARAVGFTGSFQAGRALAAAAAARPHPIPVFAEMGSVNPVFVLPGALASRAVAIGESLGKSMTLGVGQFCTKPGVIVGVRGPSLDAFVTALAANVAATAAGVMLHAGIAERYRQGLEARRGRADLRVVAESAAARTTAAVFLTDAGAFLGDPALHEELFGPAALVVACDSSATLEAVARGLGGQLTATVHGTDGDLAAHAGLLDVLRQKAGRLVFGGVPTGVEVAPAMNHGGPSPATTDPRFTSVGTAAILRFARPVCFQDAPQACLPPELQDGNPRGLWRLVDGAWTREPQPRRA